MLKAYLLRLHRWISLAFALPLAVVIVTGLILSFEPIVQVSSIAPGSVTLEKMETLLAKADPSGTAPALALRPAEGAFSLGGGPGSPARSYSLATGEEVQPGRLTGFFNSSRGLHERLIGGLGWLVTASTIAMLVAIGFGIFMGLPRLRNTLAGWHKGTAWILLPLVILSPLTGLALSFGITLQGAQGLGGAAPGAPPSAPAAQAGENAGQRGAAPTGTQPARGAQPGVLQAIRLIANGHDLSALESIRRRGPTLMARIWEGGQLTGYAVTAQGLRPLASNWPRLLHEGNGLGIWGGLANVITSLALTLLLVTGVWAWARRSLRRRQRVRERVAA